MHTHALSVHNGIVADSFVHKNAYSRWGSIDNGQLPRYVTAFNPQRDSGDLLGLSCPGECGRRYSALRVVAFLHRSELHKSQLKVLQLAEAWATSREIFSPKNVAMFVMRNESSKADEISLADVTDRLKPWNNTAFSKNLDTSDLEKLAASWQRVESKKD